MSCGVLTLFCGGFFCWPGGGVFSGGPMPQGSPGPHCGLGLRPCAAWSSAVRACPLLPVQVHGSPWHRSMASMHRPCLCGSAGAAVFPASLPRPREGVLPVGSHGGRSLRPWFFGFALAGAGASQNLANLRGCIKIGFIYGRSFSGLLKRALFPGCFSPKEKRGGKRGAKTGADSVKSAPGVNFHPASHGRYGGPLWASSFRGIPAPVWCCGCAFLLPEKRRR